MYYGYYDSEKEKVMFEEITDSTKYTLLLNERNKKTDNQCSGTAFLLFVNKKCPTKISTDRNFKIDFEVTAMPVIIFTDVSLANVGYTNIHRYSDGSYESFAISGFMDFSWNWSTNGNNNFFISDLSNNRYMDEEHT